MKPGWLSLLLLALILNACSWGKQTSSDGNLSAMASAPADAENWTVACATPQCKTFRLLGVTRLGALLGADPLAVFPPDPIGTVDCPQCSTEGINISVSPAQDGRCQGMSGAGELYLTSASQTAKTISFILEIREFVGARWQVAEYADAGAQTQQPQPITVGPPPNQNRWNHFACDSWNNGVVDNYRLYHFVYHVIISAASGSSTPHPDGPVRDEVSDSDCARSDAAPRGNGVYRIRNAESGAICLGFADAHPENVYKFDCGDLGLQQQVFTLGRRESGCYFIRNGKTEQSPPSGFCMEIENRGADEPHFVRCDDYQSHTQRWMLTRNADGTFHLVNQRSGTCLDRDSYNPGAFKHAKVNFCNDTAWQKWFLDYVRDH